MKFWILLLMMFPFIASANPTAEKVAFHQGSFTTAKAKAAQEGKLVFVDFVASWCMPCRWMDETTFSNPTLARYVKDNYIAVKIDIDDFDGFAYKQQYNIKLLPSILVFDSKGNLLEKIEESLPPSKMLKILQKHDQPQNRIRTAAPTSSNVGNTMVQPPVNTGGIINRKPLPSTGNSTSNSTNSNANSTGANITSGISGSAATIAAGDGLYRFKVSRQASNGFTVQIGAFGEYGNVLREVSKLQDRFAQPIIVHIATLNGKTVYKILIGEFSTREAAISYRENMKKSGVNGIIKDMSTMK